MSLGLSPCGLIPAGAGEAGTAVAPPNDIPKQAKFIDFNTRDYERDADGSYKRMPITRQRVLVALSSLQKGSTLDPEFGMSYPEKIDASFERRVRLNIRRAVSHMTSGLGGDGSLRILGIDVEQVRPGRVEILFRYHDNLLDQPDTVKV